MPLLEEHRFV